jgi:hypothetical protein
MSTTSNQIPKHIPSTCTERAAVRLEPWRREILEYLAAENRTTMTDEILKAIDLYFIRKGKIRRSETTRLAKQKYEQLELWNWEQIQQDRKANNGTLHSI